MLDVVARLAPQVDRLVVVLNEYAAVPVELTQWPNVEGVIPDEDFKDLGKFLPDTDGAEVVFLADDDIAFPPDYVARTLAEFRALGPVRTIAGYHASLYRRARPPAPAIPRAEIAAHRRIMNFWDAQDAPVIVDQVASGTAVMAAADLPPLAYMRGSARFTDVRLARWCFENGIRPVCLPRPEGWLRPIRHERTIYRDFTRRNPAHVAEEIWTYAFRVPGRKTRPSPPGNGVAQGAPVSPTVEKS